jgi:hypothetical protein
MDAEPDDIPANAAGVNNVEPPNPVHNMIITCGITNFAHHMTFLNIQGRDSIAAFSSMSGDWHCGQTLPLGGSSSERCISNNSRLLSTGLRIITNVGCKRHPRCEEWKK